MKKLWNLFILFALIITSNTIISQNATEPDFVILQLVTPIRASGELELILYYGNGKSEVFKKLEYSFKFMPELPNEIANALNYMSAKGYTLKATVGQTAQQASTQYIFEKRVVAK